MTKLQAIIGQFQEAMQRFQEILEREKDDVVRDSAIQRFEFNFDLAWKAIKAFLGEKGVLCNSPKDCFREAFRQQLIEYDEFWMEIIKMRNNTVHTYDEEIAEAIYKKLPKVLECFQELLGKLKQE